MGFKEDLERDGVAVLEGVFSADDIARAREQVIAHQDLMSNTRELASSRHLAGFHRYPQLEPLHLMLTAEPEIQKSVRALCGDKVRTIGLSDITVNRSQQWHKDILRGKFRPLMGTDTPCAEHHGTLFKAIVYLQDSASLKVIPGSHTVDISMDSDADAIPDGSIAVKAINARRGDVVLIDICTTHRGSRHEDFDPEEASVNPKILVSTVFGDGSSPFTQRMEVGNLSRLMDWMERNPA